MDNPTENKDTIQASELLNQRVYFRKAPKNARPGSSKAGRNAGSEGIEEYNEAVSDGEEAAISSEVSLKKVGKIRAIAFHPTKAKVVGYLVKRPDLMWMFRRGDVFVSVDGLEKVDGEFVYREDGASFGSSAEKALSKTHGVSLDDCLLWLGLPVMTEDGRTIGIIKDVEFDTARGNIRTITAGKGATADTLLGSLRIPVAYIRGFRRGHGARLSDAAMSDSDKREGDAFGAIIVSDDVMSLDSVGGVAEKAGAATAVVADKTKKTYKKVMRKTEGVRKDAGDKAKKAASAASEAVEKGAFVTGRQISRAGSMFSDFKDEFLRAMDGEDEDES